MVRVAFVIILSLLIIALVLAAVVSYGSEKPIGKNVFFIEIALIPPVFGNLLIIASVSRTVALVGCYSYYIGIDLIILALVEFCKKYCRFGAKESRKKHPVPFWVYGLLFVDIIQLALNPIFGHAFMVEEIEAYGAPYFRMRPLLGQNFHRVVCYGIVVLIMLIFVLLMTTIAEINRERYRVILIALLVAVLWQTFYIFSRAPVDRSMVGFGIFGILIFYFSLYYRPLRLLDRMLADIVSDRKTAVFLFDTMGECIWTNQSGQELTHVTETTFEFASEALRGLFGDYERLEEKKNVTYTVGSDERTRYYNVERGVFRDERGKVTGYYLNVRDNTEEKKRIEKEMYDATHDALTDLYTKEYLFQKITELLQTGKKADYIIGFLDVRDFKIVNDIFGKEFGDYALQCVADFLRESLPEGSIYGRLIGDTFGVCRPKESFSVEYVENRLSNFVIRKGNAEHRLLLNVGFCEIAEADTDISILFDRAHLVVSSIKEEHSRHVALYDSRLRDAAKRMQEITSQLHNAIQERQIVPYLQPIADRTGKIVGAEALARWIHPEQGFMSPGEFIPLFEENGMIVDVDRHIWREACGILTSWKEKYPDLFISVNISPKDFYLTDVYNDITSLVKEFGLDSKNIRVEVTETSMMTDADDKMQMLDKFRQSGFIVEMDDFGSGYSSLNMLKDMPVDVLKIDMNFLGRSRDSYRANTIVKNIINLSDDLGIASLTEGVETVEQYDLLSEMGCKLFQGYYFSKPVTLENFEGMI